MKRILFSLSIVLALCLFCGCDDGSVVTTPTNPNDTDGTPNISDETPIVSGMSSGITFDVSKNMYISTVGGDVKKLSNDLVTTYIHKGLGGLDFGERIRFNGNGFYVQNVLNVSTEDDQISEVLFFNKDGTYSNKVTTETDFSAYYIESIDIGNSGEVYVIPFSSSNIILYRVDQDGNNLTEMASCTAENNIYIPTAIAVDSQGNISLGSPSHISQFDIDGNFLKIIEDNTVSDVFNYAALLAYDSEDNLYVANWFQNSDPTPTSFSQILKYDNTGQFESILINSLDSGLSAFPDDIVIFDDIIYIVDSLTEHAGIYKFSLNGDFIEFVAYNWAHNRSATMDKIDEINRREQKAIDATMKDLYR